MYFPRDFLFSFPEESSFPQQIPGFASVILKDAGLVLKGM